MDARRDFGSDRGGDEEDDGEKTEDEEACVSKQLTASSSMYPLCVSKSGHESLAVVLCNHAEWLNSTGGEGGI